MYGPTANANLPIYQSTNLPIPGNPPSPYLV